MKNTIMTLVMLSSVSAMAQDFAMPQFGKALIHPDSSMNVVCEILTAGKSVTAGAVKTETLQFSGLTEVITLSRFQGNIIGTSFNPNLPTQVITNVTCN